MMQDKMRAFDVEKAQKGYALNKMCYSLNKAENRAAFLADEDAYCAKFGLNEEERAAVRSRDRKTLTAAGGNMYFVINFVRIGGSAREASPAPSNQP
jgi:protocatechuate 4,5-dioxygenase alpha chain